jgi:hypothetical protein
VVLSFRPRVLRCERICRRPSFRLMAN